jgi:hypothetical protein
MIRQALLQLTLLAQVPIEIKSAGLSSLVTALDQDYDCMRQSYRLSTGFIKDVLHLL